MNKRTNRQMGQAMITSVIFFLIISVVILVAMASPVANQVRNSSDFLQSKQGYIASDALNEEALYRLNKSWALPASIVLSFSGATSTAQITDVSGDKQVISNGVAGSFTRVTKGLFTLGEGLSINYGLQVGNGGLTMSGSSRVIGNVYANGNITGGGSTSITGSAIAAASTAATADQTNSASGTPAVSVSFATSSATYQDFAQSFTVSTTTAVAEISMYLKKNGSPGNATVQIMSDSSGSPSSTLLASGVLSAGNVTTSFGWIDIGFTTNPSLIPGTTYWLVINMSSNSTSNYYSVGSTNTDSYTSGSMKLGKIGNTWYAQNANYDAFFQLYLGGVSSISGMVVGSGGTGDARAFSVTGSTVSGNLYCQTGTGNNKSCDTSQPTASYLSFPFSSANITDWQDAAAGGNTYNGNLSVGGSNSTTTSSLTVNGDVTVSGSATVVFDGPLTVNGDLSIGSGASVTFNGPVYVTGDFDVSGSSPVRLGSNYANTADTIIVGGKVDIGSSATFAGSGGTGSYVVILSKSTCGGTTSCSGDYAISVSGSAGAVVLLTQYGGISFQGTAGAKSATAYFMNMQGTATLTYDSGLADINFSTGPSGAWNVSGWQEI